MDFSSCWRSRFVKSSGKVTEPVKGSSKTLVPTGTTRPLSIPESKEAVAGPVPSTALNPK
jgi:hypothetical protein